MLESETVDSARLRDGAELTLVRSGSDWSVRVDAMLLMSSRTHDSEEALAEQAPARARAIWSVGPHARFERKLTRAGFAVDVVRVSARKGSRARHVLFLAKVA